MHYFAIYLGYIYHLDKCLRQNPANLHRSILMFGISHVEFNLFLNHLHNEFSLDILRGFTGKSFTNGLR